MPFASGGHGGTVTVEVVQGGSGSGGSTNVTSPVPIIGQFQCGPIAISGNVVVRLTSGQLYTADPADPWPYINAITGMTYGAVQPGAMATVVMLGSCGGASGLQVNAAYFLGNQGVPTLTPPTSGWLVNIGTAFDSQTYNINLRTPILRA